jgi:putative FmdB family regulatory protein
MPTYEYLCKICGHQFDEFQSIVADPLQNCPKCNGKVERLINGGIGLIFKGSGFYLTDYARSKGSENGKKADASKDNKTKSENKATAGEKKAPAKAVD